MFRDIQYVTDQSGAERAVQIPISSWKKHMLEFERMKKKLQFLNELKRSAKEVRLMEKGKLPKQTLDSFLRELFPAACQHSLSRSLLVEADRHARYAELYEGGLDIAERARFFRRRAADLRSAWQGHCLYSCRRYLFARHQPHCAS